MSNPSFDPEFSCSLTISIPLPTHRLASSALRALKVDAELSPLVQRSLSLALPDEPESANLGDLGGPDAGANLKGDLRSNVRPDRTRASQEHTILRTEYKATTNRMLRVAVNGFMESLGVVLGVMEELDVDVLAESI